MDVDRFIRRRFRVRSVSSGGFPLICQRGGRLRLAEVFRDLGYTTGVEVGTREGIFAEQLFQAIPDLRLCCIDPWEEYSQATAAQQEVLFNKTIVRLSPYSNTIIRQRSLDAVVAFQDSSLDFVYIDGDHAFEAVMCDIIFWVRKVRVGGIMAGHDYFAFPDVARAVDVYTACHRNTHPWYVAREDRRTGIGGTWFWVVK